MLGWMERMERVRDGRRGACLDGWREWRELRMDGGEHAWMDGENGERGAYWVVEIEEGGRDG
jgi:hypothetical protein